MVALLHRKTDGAGEQKCEGALGISRCPTRLNDGHRACRLTFWSMTPHILIQPVSPSHRESQRHVIRSAALSPYITTHLTRFGRYSLDLARVPATLDYDLPILSTQPRAKGGEP